MTPQENFLHAVADPNVAYLLLTIGIMAIIYELASPGGVVAGVVGVISLLLGLTALSALEVNLGGLLLIVLAIALFIIDLKMPTHGVLTAGGVVALALGSMMLLSPSRTTYPIGREVIFTVVLTLTAFFVFAVGAVIKAMRKQPFMGREGYIHAIGEARKLITAEEPGTLALDGALWTAYAVRKAVIPAGERARVVRMEGLKFWVEPVDEASDQGQEGPKPSSAS
jgi:membrane-bound serine protease (ClpP class)